MNSVRRSTFGGALFLTLWFILCNGYKGYCASWSDTVIAAQRAYKARKLAEAEKLYSDALKMAEAFGTGDPRLLTSIRDLGDFYLCNKRYDKAEPLYLREIKMYQNLEYGSDEQLYDWMTLGVLSKEKGSLQKSEYYFKRALPFAGKIYGARSLKTAGIFEEIGYCCYQQKRIAEAEAFVTRALSIQTKLDPRGEITSSCISLLGNIYSNEHRYVESEHCFREVLSIQLLYYKPNDIKVLRTKQDIANSLADQHKFDQADRLFAELTKTMTVTCGPNSIAIASLLKAWASRYENGQRFASALNLLEKALKVETKLLRPSDREFVDTIERIAKVHRSAGNNEAAKQLCKGFLKQVRGSANVDKATLESIEAKLARYR